MTHKRDFAQILKEKLNSPSMAEEKSSTFQGPTSEFLHGEVSFYVNPYTWTPTKIAPSYKTKKRKVIQSESQTPLQKEAITEAPSLEPSFKIDQFSKSEQGHLQFLKSKGAQLDPQDLSLSVLKKEYRQLLKQHHPDYSKDPEACVISQQIVSSYRSLHKKILSLSAH